MENERGNHGRAEVCCVIHADEKRSIAAVSACLKRSGVVLRDVNQDTNSIRGTIRGGNRRSAFTVAVRLYPQLYRGMTLVDITCSGSGKSKRMDAPSAFATVLKANLEDLMHVDVLSEITRVLASVGHPANI